MFKLGKRVTKIILGINQLFDETYLKNLPAYICQLSWTKYPRFVLSRKIVSCNITDLNYLKQTAEYLYTSQIKVKREMNNVPLMFYLIIEVQISTKSNSKEHCRIN